MMQCRMDVSDELFRQSHIMIRDVVSEALRPAVLAIGYLCAPVVPPTEAARRQSTKMIDTRPSHEMVGNQFAFS